MTGYGQRRDRRPFEPPPWEREGAEQPEALATEAPGPAPLVEPKTGQPVQAPEEAARTEGRDEGEGKEPLDEAKADFMLLQLREQEPALDLKAWRIALVSGGLLTALGVMLTVWGTVAVGRSGKVPGAVFGAVIMLTFGLLLLGGGAWLVGRSLKQRGVF